MNKNQVTQGWVFLLSFDGKLKSPKNFNFYMFWCIFIFTFLDAYILVFYEVDVQMMLKMI